MAHYDCSNCGERMGVDFGSCSSCTPREYHDLVRARGEIRAKAERDWEAQHAAMIENFQKWKEKGIAELAKEAGLPAVEAKLHDLRMEHHRSYRYRYEKENNA